MKRKGVLFKPYVGPKYGKAGALASRILVLGESHYVSKTDGRRASLTKSVVLDYLAGRRGSRFLTIIAQLIHGSRQIMDAEIDLIWQSVSFYNYIQSPVGSGPRVRPTFEQWLAAQSPFVSVLREIRPDAIIVLGEQLWDALPPTDPGPVLRVGRSNVATKKYSLRSGSQGVIAVSVRHPSGRGFTFRKFAPRVTALLAHVASRSKKRSKKRS